MPIFQIASAATGATVAWFIQGQKLDAANRQIDGLKSAVVSLQKTVDDLQAAQKKPAEDAKKKDAPAAKDAVK